MKLIINTSGLDKALEKLKKEVQIETDKQLRHVALDLFIKVKQKTPVWTGSLRASWNMSRSTPNLAVVEIDPDLFDGAKQPRNTGMGGEKMVRPQPKTMGPIWISNNLSYARVVEFGVYNQLGSVGEPHVHYIKGKKVILVRTTKMGYSTQAPEGMLRISLLNIVAKYRS